MTAVEWLDEQLQDTMHIQYGYVNGVRKVVMPLEDYMKFKQEALELEKEQITDAYANAVMKENNSDYIGMHEQSSAEIYFAETYGSKGSDENKTNNMKQERIKEVFDTIVPIKKLTIDELLKEYGENLTESEVKILKQVLNGIENN